VPTGDVGHFNKGAFHLATELGANIVPLFIEIPENVNPGKGWMIKDRGQMIIHELDEIDTSGWSLDDLEDNAEMVRGRYLAFQRELRGEPTNPDARRAA
jgi:1-acyl-sn-glycerol-3-phosphate acyltransferase